MPKGPGGEKRPADAVARAVMIAHLHRYLAEFDFRYTNRIACGFDDAERADEALTGIAGRRLTYRRTCLAAA